jgi:hypothetical protein
MSIETEMAELRDRIPTGECSHGDFTLISSIRFEIQQTEGSLLSNQNHGVVRIDQLEHHETSIVKMLVANVIHEAVTTCPPCHE